MQEQLLSELQIAQCSHCNQLHTCNCTLQEQEQLFINTTINFTTALGNPPLQEQLQIAQCSHCNQFHNCNCTLQVQAYVNIDDTFQAQLQIETKNIQVQLQIEMKNIRFATNCTPASGRVHFDIAKDAHRIETLYFIKGLP